MTHTLRFLLATSLNVIAVLTLEAQNPFRSPTNLGKEVGILGPSCLAEDNEGFLWVGTWEGLLRFDGATARQIYYIPEENAGFGAVTDLDYEATTNTLWICSDRGICRYELSTQIIDCFEPEDYFPKGEIDKGNKCIFQDRQLEFDPIKQRFQQYFPVPESRDYLERDNGIRALEQDGSDALWVSCGAGVFRFDLSAKRFELANARALFHCKDEKGNFWGFDRSSLVCYSPFRNQLFVTPILEGQVKKFAKDASGKEIYIKNTANRECWCSTLPTPNMVFSNFTMPLTVLILLKYGIYIPI